MPTFPLSYSLTYREVFVIWIRILVRRQASLLKLVAIIEHSRRWISDLHDTMQISI